jgi:hypothetical protein
MKPDFSKEGMKRFFLYHTEKIILTISVLLMGLFFWLGFSAQPFKEKSPTELVNLADRASSYIGNPQAWEQIRGVEARTGEEDLVRRITAGNDAIDVANYPFGFWSIRAKTLSKRKDPQLVPPTELVTTHIYAPVYWSPRNLRADAPIDDPLAKFQLASEAVTVQSGSGLGGARDPGGARAGSEGDLNPGRGRGDNNRPGGAGPVTGGDDGGSSSRGDEAKKAEIDAGTEVLAIHEKTMPGIRPRYWQFSNQSEQILLGDVVVVTGLIDIKALRTSYLDSFLDSIGYFPSRDKPEFRFLEVQRAEVTEGQEAVWEDISNRIELINKATPKSLLIMPSADYPSAPESVEESVYDPVISSPIPAFAGLDYRRFVNHPKLGHRKPDPIPEAKKAESMMDFSGVASTPVDPENEEKLPVRLGRDFTKFIEALNKKDTANNYKLIRFFDVSPKDPGKVYQYRVRVWLSDPNNESTEPQQFAGGEGVGAGAGRGANVGGPGGRAGRAGAPSLGGANVGASGTGGTGAGQTGSLAGAGPGAGTGAGDRGRPGSGVDPRGGGGNPGRGGTGGTGGSGGQAGSDDDRYTYVALTPQMKTPEVRARLSAAAQKPDPKEREKQTYFIQEPGYEELIQIPEGKEFLRFCRPSPWSEPVKLKVNPQSSGDLLAGKVEIPRSIRVGTTEILEAEPSIDIVVAPWDRFLRAMLPGRKKSFRGEALDFAANAHVLNPINWLVHRIDNAPILSRSVLVDLMGGTELAISNEPTRYHTASEMLVMNPDGSLSVTNDLEDRTKYKQALLQPDDVNEVGTPRRPAPEPAARPRVGAPGGRGR